MKKSRLSQITKYGSRGEVLTVGELTERIQDLLEDTLWSCWVKGEVSTICYHPNGHVYFILKDAEAQLPCVLFAETLTKQTVELTEGTQMAVLGKLSVYKQQGAYQMVVQFLLAEGIGVRQKSLLALKQTLRSEGLFELTTKRSLPALPQKIAIITSPQGAALRDFIQILKRRGFRGDVILMPTFVQGVKAVSKLAAMLEAVHGLTELDLVVISRGGGSNEDLWAFNEERVVRALATCPVPTLSAIGHEIDHTLSDLVADVRAETPSGAAEMISSLWQKELTRFEVNCRAFAQAFEAYTQALHLNLRQATYQLESNKPHVRIQTEQTNHRQRVAHFCASFLQLLAFKNLKLQLCIKQFKGSLKPYTKLKITRLENTARRFKLLDPLRPLEQGFAVVSKEKGQLVKSSKGLNLKDTLTLRFKDGTVKVSVK